MATVQEGARTRFQVLHCPLGTPNDLIQYSKTEFDTPPLFTISNTPMNPLIQQLDYDLESLIQTTRDRTYLTNTLVGVRDNARGGDYAGALKGLRKAEGWSEDLSDANQQVLCQCVAMVKMLEIEKKESGPELREHWGYKLARFFLLVFAVGFLVLSKKVYAQIAVDELHAGYYAAFAFCMFAAFASFYAAIWGDKETVARAINQFRI